MKKEKPTHSTPARHPHTRPLFNHTKPTQAPRNSYIGIRDRQECSYRRNKKIKPNVPKLTYQHLCISKNCTTTKIHQIHYMKKYETIILNTTIKAGIPKDLALLIIAQAKHETANFTSKVFKQNNNAFGYKYIKGATLQLEHGRISPEGNAYAHYKNLKNSTKEIINWIYRRLKEKKFPELNTITTPEQYAYWLKKSKYYTDNIRSYTNGLKKYINIHN